MQNGSHEVRSVDEFRALALLPIGVFVITDSATGSTMHRPSCRSLREEGFVEKVVRNGGRNGRYYHFLRLEDAASALGASPCSVCI